MSNRVIMVLPQSHAYKSHVLNPSRNLTAAVDTKNCSKMLNVWGTDICLPMLQE